MNLPNWFKIFWWFLLVGLLTAFLWFRLPNLLGGKGAASDIVGFGVWAALMLAPMFAEVTILGVTLKKEVEELRESIAGQFSDLRNDVRTAVDVRTNISPAIHFGMPPADAALPALTDQINAAIAQKLREAGLIAHEVQAPLRLPPAIDALLGYRYHLEVAVRRLADLYGLDNPLTASVTSHSYVKPSTKRNRPVSVLVSTLYEFDVIDASIADAVKKVYTVCSGAAHGSAPTDAQLKFVQETAPGLIAALESIPPPPPEIQP